MARITAQQVRDQWAAVANMPRVRVADEVQRFAQRQPFLQAYVLATTDDEGEEATGITLQLAYTIDAVYQDILGRPARRITETIMDEAADIAEQSFAELIGVEPELALRRFLFARDTAEPELLAVVIELMHEEAESTPSLKNALGIVFLATKAVALAYEHANRLSAADGEKSSLGQMIEQRIGGPLPKIGRNDPCPCGSGRKFKKCCGEAETPPEPVENLLETSFGDSEGEQRFVAYMKLVEEVWDFTHRMLHGRDRRWLERQSQEFERQFRPGEPGGVPDSLHVSYVVADLTLPTSGKSPVAVYLESQRHLLADPKPALLRHIADSYAGFYELIECRPANGTKRLREVGTGVEWIVRDIEDVAAEFGEVGEVWCCRFLGSPSDAIIFSSPMVFPPTGREIVEAMVRDLMQPDLDAGLAPPEALRVAMKREVSTLADFLAATAAVVDGVPDDQADDWDDDDADEDEDVLDEPEDDPEVAHELEQFAIEHYRTWPDRPVPALQGKTPRAAARTKPGRRIICDLLDVFEQYNAGRPKGAARIDVEWLRRELGLDR